MTREYTIWQQDTTSALMSKAIIWNSRQRYVPKLVYRMLKNYVYNVSAMIEELKTNTFFI